MLPQERDSLLHSASGGDAGYFELPSAVSTEQFPPESAHPTARISSVSRRGAGLELNEDFTGDELRHRALRLYNRATADNYGEDQDQCS
jgi:hypothetical protein